MDFRNSFLENFAKFKICICNIKLYHTVLYININKINRIKNKKNNKNNTTVHFLTSTMTQQFFR